MKTPYTKTKNNKNIVLQSLKSTLRHQRESRLVYNTLTGIYNTITRQDEFCDHNKTSQYCQHDSKYVPSKAIPRVSYCVKCAGTVPPPVQPPPRSPVSYGEAGEGKRRFVKLNGMCIVFFFSSWHTVEGLFFMIFVILFYVAEVVVILNDRF